MLDILKSVISRTESGCERDGDADDEPPVLVLIAVPVVVVEIPEPDKPNSPFDVFIPRDETESDS
jgi:hypothetical protein